MVASKMTETARTILVTGANGFLGKHVCRQLAQQGQRYHRTSLSMGCDFREHAQAQAVFRDVKPTHVLNCMAYVGGIQWGYRHFGEIFKNNLLMTVNLLEACREFGVRRLVNPIANCAYPGQATIFRESEFWDGPLHDSVLVYGSVRKASWVGAWAYQKQYGLDSINFILSNMYGDQDHFEPERSHALGALVYKIIEAKVNAQPQVVVWGTGNPIREWLFVDEGAEAMIRGMDLAPYAEPINIGCGKGISIGDLARTIAELAGYQGELVFDPSKPDGAPHKIVDGSLGERLMGWKPKKNLREGIRETIDWYTLHREEFT
jgi:GDP-L-fucose synthase